MTVIELIAGIDLGKTTCRVRALRDGQPLGTVEVPGARGLADPGGVDAARAAIVAGLAAAGRAAGLAPDAVFDVVAVGAAGREAAASLGEALATGLPARRLVLTSDAITSHVGAFGGADGAMVAIGTGAVGLGLGPLGLVQVDGLGHWLGDDGGGAWIGRLALRHALDTFGGHGVPTSLVTAAEARYGDLARLPGTLAASDTVAATAAAIVPDVIAAAEAGDAVALRVLDAAGAALARTLAHAAAASGSDRVTAVGGLASVPLLVDALRSRLPDGVTWVAAVGTSLDGAVLLARRDDLPHETHVLRRRRPETVDIPTELGALDTERVRGDLDDLDQRSPAELVALLLEAEATVPAAVAAARDAIVAAASLAEKALVAGGRIVYVGAGTSGRLAAQDAAEIPPTYGTDRVVALLAGGGVAGARAVEGAEDDGASGASDVRSLRVGPDDLVVGIAASGRTPYVVEALRTARERLAPTVAIVNNPGSLLSREADVAIELLTGPEVVAGSTRMKAGTAQKVVLNVLSTTSMVLAGKTYGAWMVDVHTSNDKLRARARRILREATGAGADEVDAALDGAAGRTKVALVALLAGVDADVATAALDMTDGRAREAVARLTGGAR